MSNGHKIGPYNEHCHHLWDSLAPSVHILLCSPVGPGHFCALPRECLALWRRQHLNVSVRHASSILGMHHMSWYYTYSIHLHQVAVDFTSATHITHNNQNTLHTWKVCLGSGRPSIFNLTYLCYPFIAVQWHNLHVPITCLNLQFRDTISCQTCCYLIFFKPCVPVRGRQLKIRYKEHIQKREYNWDE